MSRLCARGAILAVTALVGIGTGISEAGTTAYTYDALGRVIAVTYPSGTADNFQYDSAGNRTQVVRATSAIVAPTVGNTSLTVAYNTAGSVALLPSGSYSSLAIASAPSHGAASISATTATYTPTSGYSGADSFTYTATGPGGTSAPATVSVTVQAPTSQPPVCSNATTNMNVPTSAGPVSVSITATSFFTGNCTDAAGYTLTLSSPTLPDNFTVSAHQTVTIPYTVSDGHGNTGSATVYFVRP